MPELKALRNIDGKPFDFQRWKDWLRQNSDELTKAGFRAKFGSNDVGSKPSAGVSAESDARGGYFSTWVTGETDFEVLDKGSGERPVDKMGLILNDSNFEDAFAEFRRCLTP